MRPEQSVDLRDRRCRFSIFLESSGVDMRIEMRERQVRFVSHQGAGKEPEPRLGARVPAAAK